MDGSLREKSNDMNVDILIFISNLFSSSGAAQRIFLLPVFLFFLAGKRNLLTILTVDILNLI